MLKLKNSKCLKIIIDSLMFIIMLLEFSKVFTGQFVHELLGIIFLVLFILHNLININFYKKLFKGKYNNTRILMTIVNIGLLLFITLTILLGIPISKKIFVFFHIDSGMLISKLHILFSYYSLIFMAMHLGLHYKVIFKNIIGKTKNNKVLKYTLLTTELIIIILGINSSIDINLINYILGKSTFGLKTGNIILSIYNTLLVVLMISVIVYNLEILLLKYNKRKKEL